MKTTKIPYYFGICTLLAFLFSCADANEISNETSSKLFFKSESSKMLRSSEGKTENDTILFTGNDIDWFNETTGELKFKSKFTDKDILYLGEVRIYLDVELLFTLRIIPDIMSYVFNEPVLYYENGINKFFIKDGYPDWKWSDDHPVMIERKNNKKKIEKEWNKFIDQLKKEGKYKK